MITKIGKNNDAYNQRIINEFYDLIKDTFDGFLYCGYPIYNDKFSPEPMKVDAIMLTNKGLLVLHITQQNIVDFTDIQDNLYTKIELKLKSYKFLLKNRMLQFPINVISFCEKAIGNNNIAVNVMQLVELVKQLFCNEISMDLLQKTNSAIQEAYGLGRRTEIDYVQGTKSELIVNMNNIIETFDPCQMEAILADPVGIQRIRGMAGSGKTIVLARKAVELHTAHPEWKILVTYNTRSVKKMLEELIEKLYLMKNEGRKPNYSNLIIMHGWGSSNSPGFYYYICKAYDKEIMTLDEAKFKFGSKNAFEGSCKKLTNEIQQFRKLFDCILIDEAQDFPVSFFKLCLKNLDKNKRLVYAYDELQKLNEDAMPIPKKIFDRDIAIDTPLRVSYRNQRSVIVTAHAIGMGIYRDINNQNKKLVQLPDSNDIWDTIGYKCDETIVEHNEVRLYRTQETSPNYLNADVNSLVKVYKYTNRKEQYEELVDLILEDLSDQLVPMKEIMIIDMDSINHKKNYQFLIAIINNLECFEDDKYGKVKVHLAGSLTPEDFSRNNSIVYSSINRAKGNESYVVYIINGQECMSSLTSITKRNEIFTAITRSKGWVNVLGYGEQMDELDEEFNSVKANNYTLYFKSYPDESEKKLIRTTNVDLKKDDVAVIDNMEKILSSLSDEKFDEILKKFKDLKKNKEDGSL